MKQIRQSFIGLLISISYIYGSTISVPGDYSTIQEAINASGDGDSIAVDAGTYYENINFFGKSIKVVGEDQATTIIDGSTEDIDSGGVLNGGFESYYQGENDWQLLPHDWYTWESNNSGPSNCCYMISFNGESVYQSDSTFYTYEGAAALKMWGSSGEWNVYQEFYDISSGSQIDLTAMVYQATDDHIGEGSNFYIFIKYFDNDWNFLGIDYSQEITTSDSMDAWLTRSVSGTVPDDNLIVQVGMIYIGGGGAVYIDDFQMNVNGEIFVSNKYDQGIIDYNPLDYPDRSRQGGDTVEDAVVLNSIPYSNFGNTQGYTDNYEEQCDEDDGVSTSPDVVYSYTPSGDEIFNVSTCGNGSYYDTKLFVYENTVGNLAETIAGEIACNDDACSNNHQNWLSGIYNINALAGNTYFIVVDGWGGQSGDYQLMINYPQNQSNVVVFENHEDNNTLLKNFTITNGSSDSGGGIFLENMASPTLQNLTITNNYGNNGGGIAGYSGSSPTLINININNNTSDNEGGGLHFNSGDSHVRIYGCTIENNVTGNQGGGLWSKDTKITVENSIIRNNISWNNQGGGFWVENSHPFVINNTEFEYNQGHGLYVNHGSGHRISNVVCSNNSESGFFSHYSGPYQISNLNVFDNENGGIYLVGSSPVISNSLIVNNRGSEPGIRCQSTSNPMIVNCTVANNRLESNYEESGSEIIVIDNSKPLIENSIIWGSGSQTHSIYLTNWWGEQNSIILNYSIIKNDQAGILNDYDTGILWGEGNIEAVQDPLFESMSENNFHLLNGSPAIDWGNPAGYHNDLDGSRNDIGYDGGQGIFLYIRGQNPDTWNDDQDFYATNLNDFYMGYAGVGRSSRSFELHIINNGSQAISLSNWTTTDNQFHVNNYQNDINNNYFPMDIEPFSSSWINNVRQMWLEYSPDQPGENIGTINLLGSNGSQDYNFTFNLTGIGYLIPEDVIHVPEHAPSIQFAIDNSSWYDTIRVAPGTYVGRVELQNRELYLIGDDQEYPVLTVDDSQGLRSVVNMTNSGNSLLKNFIITGGRGEWCGNCDMPNGDNHAGGGVFINRDDWNDWEVTARLENLIIQNNTALYGAGVFARRGSVSIKNCIIKENISYEEDSQRGLGGGILIMHQNGDNSVDSEIINTVINNNFSHEGGGVVLWQNNWGNNRVLFENVIVQGNSAHYQGGVWLMDADAAFLNSTILQNITEWSDEQGSGLDVSNSGSRARVVNSIFHDNSPHNLGVQSDSVFIDYSIITNGQNSIYINESSNLEWGQNNIDTAPDIDYDDSNFGLMGYSVGIGDGSPNGILGGWTYMAPEEDINGDPRPNPEGSTPDIGATENQLGRSQYRLEVDTVYTIHGDTALLSINNISTVPLIAIDLNIEGYQGTLELLDVVTDNTTLFGQNNWVTFFNDTEDSLLIASAGTSPISTIGTLLKLKFAVSELLESQFIPITITGFSGDEDYTDFNAIPGGLQVVWGPEVGFIAENTTGAYPLTVTFTDTSTSGTFSIDIWDWSFGNDSVSSEQNTSFTYIYPGEYEVALRIEDGFGLVDSISYPSMVQVDTIFGDVSWNGVTQAFDASLILKHLVDIQTMTQLQIEIGDVSENDTLSTLDASLILQYAVGLVNELPLDAGAQYTGTGQLIMENQGIFPGMTLEIPINMINGSNIFGFRGSINYDPDNFTFDTLLLADEFSGYFLEYNKSIPGNIMIASAGGNVDLGTGLFSTIIFHVSDDFVDETIISLNNWEWNDGQLMNNPASMVVSYGLGIKNGLIPKNFALHQNYPNPFNPTTQIKYDLPEVSLVEIKIYDIMGRIINNLLSKNMDSGYHSVRWDATNNLGESVSAGMYIYSIQAGNFKQTKKMILLK